MEEYSTPTSGIKTYCGKNKCAPDCAPDTGIIEREAVLYNIENPIKIRNQTLCMRRAARSRNISRTSEQYICNGS